MSGDNSDEIRTWIKSRLCDKIGDIPMYAWDFKPIQGQKIKSINGNWRYTVTDIDLTKS